MAGRGGSASSSFELPSERMLNRKEKRFKTGFSSSLSSFRIDSTLGGGADCSAAHSDQKDQVTVWFP